MSPRSATTPTSTAASSSCARSSSTSCGRRQQWQSLGIDLERDKEQWKEIPDEQRAEHLWGLSSFFLGEERVTTQFSGLVMAYSALSRRLKVIGVPLGEATPSAA